jgi:glycosyltransferase involved in cell wall biosynthesis
VPLIVQFHGYDASTSSVLERNARRYEQLFEHAPVLFTPSGPMRETLLALGAPPERTHHVPNGVDTSRFRGAAPAQAPPVFLACGRFAEKKGPLLTIAAFAAVRRTHPEARLRMIGDGPLRTAAWHFARGLAVGDAVTFLGEQPPELVADELRRARAFVQHSVLGIDGNSEGTPVAILEASASGLPVVATRHGGIPDAVVDGETGLLVDEHDVEGMARQLARLVTDAELAGTLGRAGRRRMEDHFTIEASVARKWSIIKAALLGDR